MDVADTNNEVVWAKLDSYIDDSSDKNKQDLLKLFDDYNDGDACKRIVNYLKENV